MNGRSGHSRALVVDDDPGVRSVVTRLVTGAGFATRSAHDGQAALEIAENDAAVDLLVTDINMPRCDGVTLAAKLAARWPNIRILLISAYKLSDEYARKLTGVRYAFLPKPFETTDVYQTIEQLMA